MAMESRAHKPGFILVMVLVVLAVCGALLGMAARRCARRALDASEALRQLQLRWGAMSCQATLLPAAEALLRQAELANQEPTAAVNGSVSLGGIEFGLRLADEQAKADANLLAHRQGDRQLTASLRRLQSDRKRPLPVRLRPTRFLSGVISGVPIRYASYDQLLVFQSPSQLVGDAETAQSPVARITCWAGGKVNLKRADKTVLRRALAGLLDETQIDRLVDYRRKFPDCSLGALLRHLELKRDNRNVLEPLVTATSTCHSLWVVAGDAARRWHRFYVVQQGDEVNDRQLWSFLW